MKQKQVKKETTIHYQLLQEKQNLSPKQLKKTKLIKPVKT